jgi:hypothetical protein
MGKPRIESLPSTHPESPLRNPNKVPTQQQQQQQQYQMMHQQSVSMHPFDVQQSSSPQLRAPIPVAGSKHSFIIPMPPMDDDDGDDAATSPFFSSKPAAINMNISQGYSSTVSPALLALHQNVYPGPPLQPLPRPAPVVAQQQRQQQQQQPAMPSAQTGASNSIPMTAEGKKVESEANQAPSAAHQSNYVRLFSGTWNLHAKSPPADMAPFLPFSVTGSSSSSSSSSDMGAKKAKVLDAGEKSESVEAQKMKALSANAAAGDAAAAAELEAYEEANGVDIYVIGTEECQHSIGASFFRRSKAKWVRNIEAALGWKYKKVCEKSMVAMHIVVYVRRDRLCTCRSPKLSACVCLPYDPAVHPKSHDPFTNNLHSGGGGGDEKKKDGTVANRFRINKVSVASFATGAMCGLLGNKGAVGCCFNVGKTSFAFVNCHFHAGQTLTGPRNDDFNMINSGLQLRRGTVLSSSESLSQYKRSTVLPEKGANSENAAGEAEGRLLDPSAGHGFYSHTNSSAVLLSQRFDHVVWMGDLNYRTEAQSRSEVDLLLQRGLVADVLHRDQLNTERRLGAVFPASQGWKEGDICFGPTYKFDKNCDVFDSSKKQRMPSWTDRILFKSNLTHSSEMGRPARHDGDLHVTPMPIGSTPTSHHHPDDVKINGFLSSPPAKQAQMLYQYNSVAHIKTSDHRPVYALFDMYYEASAAQQQQQQQGEQKAGITKEQ